MTHQPKVTLTIRQEVWLRAWCHVAQADNCNNITSPERWADQCLVAFEKRFPSSSIDETQTLR